MRRATGLLTLVALVGCGGGGAAPQTITGNQPVVAMVEILPNVVRVSVGQRLQLQLVATDQLGHPVAGGNVRYQVADPTVASVDGQGEVTGLEAGVTTLTATVTWPGSSKAATASIEVTGVWIFADVSKVTTPMEKFLLTLLISASDPACVKTLFEFRFGANLLDFRNLQFAKALISLNLKF